MRSAVSALFLSLSFTPAFAEPPRVVVDTAPVHGLVSQVMQGVGVPELIMQRGASPHHYALRPSEAAMLEEAQVVFYVGAGLTPWLEDAAKTLSGDARRVALSEAPGTHLLTFREGVSFEHEAHADHDDHGNHEEHDHDDHGGNHDHEHAGHDDDHGHGHKDHDHAAGDTDPHAWLDPENAALWLDVIAEALAAQDTENAALYRENAADGRERITALTTELQGQMAPLQDRPFIVFHDAYQYFEARFGLKASAAVSLGDASAPGAARLAAVRDLIHEKSIACAFIEPQFSPRLIETVAEGSDVRIIQIDPQGTDIPLGPDFYPALLRGIADSFLECL